MDKNHQIREIEKKIDNLFRSHKLMQLPRSIAVQYLLMIHEDANRFPILSGELNPLVDRFNKLALTENSKHSLTHSINWAFKTSRIMPEKIVSEIDKDIYITTVRFFELAFSYHGAVSAYTMWSRGFAEAALINKNTVHFKYSEEEARYDMLDGKLYFENSKKHFEEASGANLQRLIKARTAIEETVKQTGKHTISYSIKKIDCDEIMTTARNMITGQTIPPADWHFDNLTTEYFKKFWSALLSICLLHIFALFYAARTLGIEGGAIASTIIVRTKDNWIRQLSRWSSLSEQIISQILEYHTYSDNHKKPDIVLTPFIFVTEKHLALTPTLITTNNLGRNLLKHLAKNYKDEYDRNSGVFEDSMISEFCNSIKRKYFRIYPRLKIPDNKELPDIDVCLMDEANRQVMFCEFKWTIPAAEPSEVMEKQEIEKKALSQLGLLKKYFYNQPTKIAKVLKVDNSMKFDKMFFVGVLKNFVGNAFMFNKDIPLIEYTIFCKLLNENTSLEEVFNYIKERKFLPKANIDFRWIDMESVIGKFKISWGGYRPIK